MRIKFVKTLQPHLAHMQTKIFEYPRPGKTAWRMRGWTDAWRMDGRTNKKKWKEVVRGFSLYAVSEGNPVRE